MDGNELMAVNLVPASTGYDERVAGSVLLVAGYGQTGPYQTAAGYDVVIEGEAGLMHM